ncbi:MAG TPA: tetratricopeptide repeat protein, partial [Pyrinomonadaceae bacterium]|nr:tetratricopeptide repeat protein [Pyrinomonadaceae bacterium]
MVNLADARARVQRLRSRGGQVSREELLAELEEIHLLLDNGLSSEVKSRLAQFITASRHDPSLLAQARCMLSASLEMQGRYRESLEAVQMYEAPEARAKLDAEANNCLRVQIGLAYNYSGDHPKAIALFNAALREEMESGGSHAHLGAINSALARVYRSISEFTIARDYSQKALEHYRETGDWRGLADAYFGIAMADTLEGNHEAGLENFEQALKLVGDHPAPYLLGKIYSNMAGACWFLKRAQEGIRYLEKAIGYYERTEHKSSAALGYNNLGINLILVGDWERAHEALERALSLASETDERGAQIPMILDSLGDLSILRGEMDEARDYLDRAVALATEHGNKWYSGQALRTLGRCYLALGEPESASEKGRQALDLAESIGDRQAVCESRLILAEAHLLSDELQACEEELQKVADQTTDSTTDLGFAGEAQRLYGLLAMAHEDSTLAAQHFARSVSIFEMLGDRYRATRASYELGRACAFSQPERAAENLARAVHTFRELGASLDLARAEEALAALGRNAPDRQNERSALAQLLTLRLAEAVASRELLLRELAAVLDQETNAGRVMIFEPAENNQYRTVVAHGCTIDEAGHLADELSRAKDEAE